MPAYLENSSPNNTKLYEKFGFVIKETVKLGGKTPIEFMWRAPKTTEDVKEEKVDV